MAKLKLLKKISAWAGVAVLAALFVVAAVARFQDLGDKPMHADEAEQAHTLGRLLAGDGYRYNPKEHHGPTLYYLAAAVCKIAGKNSLAELDTETLRFLPAAFGTALAMLPLLWWRWRSGGDGSAAVADRGAGCSHYLCVAVALGATSPTAIYYARYFVQESLFVACFWAAIPLLCLAFQRSGSSLGKPGHAGVSAVAAAAGALFGLAVASKETWVLMVAAVAAGGAAVALLNRKAIAASLRLPTPPARCVNFTFPADFLWQTWKWRVIVLAVFAVLAAAVAIAFFSSFGSNPAGVVHSVTTYFNYSDKAFTNAHTQGFAWYWETFFPVRRLGKVSFVLERYALLGALAAVVPLFFKSAWRGAERNAAVFSLVSGGVLLLLYSVIRYKTPWLILGVLPPLWMATAFGLTAWTRLPALAWTRLFSRNANGTVNPGQPRSAAAAPAPAAVNIAATTVAFGLIAAAAWSQWQSAAFLSHRLAADERNPLAYVHTLPDAKTVETLADRFAAFAPPEKFPLFVRVHAEYAPLLWYLRRYDAQRRVWFSRTASTRGMPPETFDAPIVITSPATDAAVKAGLRAKYVSEVIGLRPGVLLILNFREDLYQQVTAEK